MPVQRRLPEGQIRDQISEAIRTGEGLREAGGELAVVRSAYETWDKRNEIFLDRAFSSSGWLGPSTPKDEYVSAVGLKYPFGPAIAENVSLPDLLADVDTKIARLRNVLGILDAYDGPPDEEADAPIGGDGRPTIFIVHGRDTTARMEVELLIRRATSAEPVVLADQLNGGSVTLIEKLEEHLGRDGRAEFAVVIMSADDLGRLNAEGEDLKPRARQNVVLELGFAMAALGRRNVAILHEEGIDLPSDINGVAYYPLDSTGAWKTRIAGELRAADFDVDADALIS